MATLPADPLAAILGLLEARQVEEPIHEENDQPRWEISELPAFVPPERIAPEGLPGAETVDVGHIPR